MNDAVEAGSAHVWIVPLEAMTTSAEECVSRLSLDERARCDRLHDNDARRRFVHARYALRHVLGERLGRAPESLVFLRGERGKPVIADVDGLDFSFSDCREYALIALAAAPTGVDGEHDRPLRHRDRTARRIFHPETVARIEAEPARFRSAAFLTAWTQREAHVKAVGGGLFHTADTLPFDPHQPMDGRACVVRDRATGDRWSIARFRPSPATVATIALHSEIDVVHIHRLLADGRTTSDEESVT